MTIIADDVGVISTYHGVSFRWLQNGRGAPCIPVLSRSPRMCLVRLVAPILIHSLSTVGGIRARSKFQARADFCRQNRSIPNMKSNATVTAPDSSNDPRQPNRFEKKKNILPAFYHLPGRSTTLITPSSLSRNFLYIAGASSRLAGCVTTKLGSISPASILCKSGLV